MINNGGWTEMTMPSCVAPGQYLLRAEMIALHSASTTGGAQFYMGCAMMQGSNSASIMLRVSPRETERHTRFLALRCCNARKCENGGLVFWGGLEVTLGLWLINGDLRP